MDLIKQIAGLIQSLMAGLVIGDIAVDCKDVVVGEIIWSKYENLTFTNCKCGFY